MLERIKHMLIKEFLQALRDPRMKLLIFGAPIIMLLLFGYAATNDVQHIATAVYDLDNSVGSREVISRFVKSRYFDVVEYVSDDRRARELLDRGQVRVVLRMDRGFKDDLRAGRTARLQLLVDGTDSNTAGIVLGYAARITEQFSQERLQLLLKRLAGNLRQPGQVNLATRVWFNENLESRNYFVPGVIAILVALITLLLTSLAVVREKEIGTMEQIMVTPITPLEFILGKTVPFAIVSFVDVVVVTTVGVFWFDVPIHGSIALLLCSSALYLLTALGVGLLISTVSETQQQAMMTTFFFFMPAILLSGFIFPIANMPRVVQWLTYLNPMRYFLVLIRGIFLKGAGVAILWPQMAGMAAIGVATLWLATRRFRKTLA
jgi:ABC-2 type transport system permease protein